MSDRGTDWLRQAKEDLSHAIDSQRPGRPAWPCLAVQQAAEEAVKATN